MSRAQRERSFLLATRLYREAEFVYFLTLISVYVTNMLLTGIKWALSGSLKTPALIFDWLTSDAAGFYTFSVKSEMADSVT
jgi:hypothetical protein